MTANVLLLQGDLTKEATDAIVNAANERMLGGGGVYGYPIRDAATIAATVVRDNAWDLDEIRFVLSSVGVLDTWTQAFA